MVSIGRSIDSLWRRLIGRSLNKPSKWCICTLCIMLWIQYSISCATTEREHLYVVLGESVFSSAPRNPFALPLPVRNKARVTLLNMRPFVRPIVSERLARNFVCVLQCCSCCRMMISAAAAELCNIRRPKFSQSLNAPIECLRSVQHNKRSCVHKKRSEGDSKSGSVCVRAAVQRNWTAFSARFCALVRSNLTFYLVRLSLMFLCGVAHRRNSLRSATSACLAISTIRATQALFFPFALNASGCKAKLFVYCLHCVSYCDKYYW